MKFPFPENFLFGASSSAVQIEAGCHEGGKGEDVQDRNFKLHPERYNYADPKDSADFYHRYPEDIQMMKDLGLKAFRFSISWARIYPNGPEQVSPEGLAYYEDVVDHLLDAGIVPFFDLWHCDLPMWVAERDGLLNPEFADWFTSYAKTVFEVLGDKVAFWSTVNEPHVNCMIAYHGGLYPPYTAGHKDAIIASHNLIIAHYRTIHLYKQMGCKGQIGAVIYLPPCYAANPGNADDLDAAKRWQDYRAGWWLDPMLKGHYPTVLLEYPYISEKLPEGYREQMEKEFIPCDFIAINYYDPFYVKYISNGELDCKSVPNENLQQDAYGFTNDPQGMFDAVMYLKNTYPGKDIYITENGIGVKKWGNFEEERNDDYRVNYMREHLRFLSRAIQAGAPVKGYFHWSIMDTSELTSGGYDLIFGLTQINYETKERRPRTSWYYYQKVIRDGFVD